MDIVINTFKSTSSEGLLILPERTPHRRSV
jgi:hypothetical protein